MTRPRLAPPSLCFAPPCSTVTLPCTATQRNALPLLYFATPICAVSVRYNVSHRVALAILCFALHCLCVTPLCTDSHCHAFAVRILALPSHGYSSQRLRQRCAMQGVSTPSPQIALQNLTMPLPCFVLLRLASRRTFYQIPLASVKPSRHLTRLCCHAACPTRHPPSGLPCFPQRASSSAHGASTPAPPW